MRIIFVLLLGAMYISVITACETKKTIPANDELEVLADWPAYSIEQMMSGKSDLVVLAHVDSVEQGKGEDEHMDVQRAKLDIQEVFYGEPASGPITLYQSTDRVKSNATYMLFLIYRPGADVYAVADGNSQTLVSEGNDHSTEGELIEVKVKGIKGKYTIDELYALFDKYNN